MRTAAIALMLVAPLAQATFPEKQIPENNTTVKTVVVVQRDRDNSLAAALIGAGVTWLVMHHRKHRDDQVTVRECAARVEREHRACVAK